MMAANILAQPRLPWISVSRYWWVNARKMLLQCISNGVMSFWHWPINIIWILNIQEHTILSVMFGLFRMPVGYICWHVILNKKLISIGTDISDIIIPYITVTPHEHLRISNHWYIDRLFQQLVQVNTCIKIKENIKPLHYWPFVRGFYQSMVVKFLWVIFYLLVCINRE